MQSALEDFGHIALRLNEIAKEKQPTPTAKPADEPAAWDALYGFAPDIEDIYCA